MARRTLTLLVAIVLAALASAGSASDSGKHGRIALSLYQDRADADILAFDAASGATANLTHTPDVSEFSPSWRPGGKTIAFTGHGWLWTVRLDGHRLRRLTRADNDGTSWSPTGRKIAFARGVSQKDKGIYVVDLNDGGLRRLTRARRIQDLDLDPAWSPDGRTIAFERNGDGIWLMNPDGSRKHHSAFG